MYSYISGHRPHFAMKRPRSRSGLLEAADIMGCQISSVILVEHDQRGDNKKALNPNENFII